MDLSLSTLVYVYNIFKQNEILYMATFFLKNIVCPDWFGCLFWSLVFVNLTEARVT